MKGVREGRDVDAMQLATVCKKLGAEEILLNCIYKDVTNSGFDIELVKHISKNVSITGYCLQWSRKGGTFLRGL